uniref:TNFR-Cys domain-containing protein n=1 Tax=Plectus sambesii TaxID=2011161 RepID=A0A914V535_9BILA
MLLHFTTTSSASIIGFGRRLAFGVRPTLLRPMILRPLCPIIRASKGAGRGRAVRRRELIACERALSANERHDGMRLSRRTSGEATDAARAEKSLDDAPTTGFTSGGAPRGEGQSAITLNDSAARVSAAATEMTPATCAANQTFDAELGRCCTVCAKGSGVSLPCTETNDTECDRCREVNGHRTFSASDSYRDVCETCSICPENAWEVHQCNDTHNTKCQCHSNYYGNVRSTDSSGVQQHFGCRKCTVCSSGTYVELGCSLSEDAVCKLCPADTFSRGDNWVKCQPCRTCPSGTKLLQSCTKTTDTVCSDSAGWPQDADQGRFFDNGSNLIPLYCSVLGAVFIGLVIYVIVKRWRVCRPSKAPVKSTTAVPLLAPTSSSSLPYDMPLDICVVKQHLSPSKHKSRQNAGYSNNLAVFKQQAAQTSKSVALVMLDRWNTDSCDLHSLIAALNRLKRPDLTELVCKDAEKTGAAYNL